MTEQHPWLDKLNPQQRAAATHGDGPLLVVAGAGSGKTRTLAYRVAVLIERGIAPERIMLLTFTRRAAEEMLKRAASAVSVGPDMVRRVWGGTFHSIAHRLLRIHAQAAGLSPEFTIVDQGDAQDVMNVIRHELGCSTKDKRFPRKSTCLAIYSRCMNTGEELEQVLSKWYPWCEQWESELTAMFKAYVERKQDQNVLDYDDLLLYWCYLLEDRAAREAIGNRFDHILVDEYQDTNRVQADILRLMRHDKDSIMVVGDDAQSIYGFRGATVRNMLDFPRQFQHTRVVTLEQNYRSCGSILATTNALIQQSTERFSKKLWSEREGGELPHLITCRDESQQDEQIIDRVLAHYEQGIPLRRQAVLCRAGFHSNSLELALTRRNIPFRKYGGLRFVETAHVKDLVAFLRVLENPRDQMAWFRILQLIEGIGPVTAAAGFEHVMANGARPSAIATFKAPPAARNLVTALGLLYKDFEKGPASNPGAEIERVIPFYKPLLERNHENPEPRLRDIEHLGILAHAQRTRADFLTSLVLDPPASTGDLAGSPSRDEDWLVLSTIHSAKGCEWSVVYLIHAADGFLPSDMAAGSPEELEEELRLTYVAMTRAENFLSVTWPVRYYHGSARRFTDSHSHAQCCRFFTPEVRRTMQERMCEGDSIVDEPVELDTPADIRARLRSRWG